MDGIRQYLISVIAAAVICGTVNGLIGQKGSVGSAIKFLCGIFMTITALSPLVQMHIPDEAYFWNAIQADGQIASAEGELVADKMKSEIITTQMQAYILDKAKSLDLSVTAEVMLNNDLLPSRVVIRGSAAPYAKKMLKNMIIEDFGISEECLEWI